jgi:hypothetical protein
MTELLELVERCERAKGPSKHLDTQIFILLDPDEQHIVGEKPGPFPREAIYGPRSTFWEWSLDESKEPPHFAATPAYTRSLDAAVTLVPEGWYWRAGHGVLWPGWAHLNRKHPDHCEREDEHSAHAATPALALCAAALKARSQLHGGDDG